MVEDSMRLRLVTLRVITLNSFANMVIGIEKLFNFQGEWDDWTSNVLYVLHLAVVQ